jgi:biotin transport system substrate-specific component
VALCAHISLPLPFTPVPLTLQNFAVLLVGMVLGPVAGFSAMVLYLVEGAIGLPVFTPYAAGGVAHLLGPNGGYLFSYPLAAATAGWVVRVMQRFTLPSELVASIAATLPIFLLGAGWFAFYDHHNAAATWAMAIAPRPRRNVKIPPPLASSAPCATGGGPRRQFQALNLLSRRAVP